MADKKRMLRRFGRRQASLLAACCAAYLAWPYVALYQMGGALRRGDVQTLSTDVEWDSVREGLKEDIADQIIAGPSVATTRPVADALPPFGSGFMTAMANNIVDRTVTPEHLAESQSEIRTIDKAARDVFQSAWFSSPTEFEARFQLPSDDAAIPVRVKMELVQAGWGMQWRITRVWVPMTMFQHVQQQAKAT